jgi:hypothetical protein
MFAALLASGAMLSLADGADAAQRSRAKYCDYRAGYYACYSTPARADRRDSPDLDRARNLDPAGDYKGYPAWAQRALAPKFDGVFR